MMDTHVPLWRPMSLLMKLLAMTTVLSIPIVAHSSTPRIYPFNVRQLAIGDFATFNTLIQDVTLYLPDTVVTDKILGITLTLDLQNLQCSNLSIGDVELDYFRGDSLSNDRVFDLNVKELDTTCIVNYNYDYGFFSGSGRVTAYTDNNSVEASLVFSQSDSSTPPDALRVENCQPVVAITNLDFDGGVVSTILDVIDGLIRGFIANEVETYLCDFVGKLNGTTDKLLGTIETTLNKYLVDVEEMDPLQAERELNITDQSTLVDLQKKTGFFSISANALLKEASRVLAKTFTNSETGRTDLEVNALLRRYLLDDTGSFGLKASDVSLPNNGVLIQGTGNFTNSLIAVQAIRLVGLDSFTRFDSLTAIGQFTVATSFAWEQLIVEAVLLVEFTSLNTDGVTSKVSETVTFGLQFDQINVTAAILLAVDVETLSALQIGSLLDLDISILPCLFSVLSAIEVPQLQVSVGRIATPAIVGFDSPGLERVLTSLIDGLYDMYDDAIARALPAFFATTVRELIGSTIRSFIDTPDEECPVPVSPTEFEFVDFRELFLSVSESISFGATGSSPFGDLVVLLRSVMDTELVAIDTTTGLPKINDAIIDPLTELQSNETGTISFPGNLLDLNAGFSIEGLAANVRFEVSDVRIENLNTVGEPLRLLDPVSMEPYVLDNALTAGTSITPLRLAAHVLLEVIGDGELNVYDEVTLSVDITAATVALLVFLKLRSDQFVRFPIGNILNLNCWLATMPATELDSRGVRVNDQDTFASVQRLNLDLERIALDVKCINCSSPLLFDLSASLTAPGAVEDATKSANKVLDYFIALVEGEFLQNKIDRLLNEAPMKCPHSPEFVDNPIKPIYTPFENSEESDSVTFVITLAMSTLGIIFAWALVSYAVKCFVRRRNVRWLRSLPDEKILSIYRYQCQQKEQEAALNETTSSMFSSSEIPIIVRWLVPLIILGNIGFFLSGHLSIGGTVIVKVSLAGQEITIEDFFQFSIAQSTLDLWNAGGKALAILILIFSGVWPYAKMFITLFCWFVPPSRLSVTRRGSILIWLDVMAKWSTIDIFVMVVSLVAFRITISSPKLSFLPSEFYSVDLLVVPLWGLYANLIAQLLSQITSHYVIYYHRSIVRNGMATVCTNESEIEEVKGIPAIAMSGSDTRKDALKDQAFSRPHRGEKDLLGVRPGVNEGLLTAVALLFVLTISGCALPCFSVDILGILGIAVQSGQDFQPAITNYSVFDIMKLLLDEAALLGTPKDWIGLLSISLVFLLTILVVPLIQGLLLLYHWWLPMTQPRHHFFVALIEICQAWQFLEVFVIAIMVSAWQLGPVSEFLINSYCDSLQPTLAALVYFGIIADEDAQCFKVRASIESGTFFMISAAFVLSFLNGFVVTAAAQYQRDCIARDEALRQDIKPDHQTIRMLEEGNVEETIEKIQPMPALFTDQFRWWLVSNSRMREEENAITVDPQPQVQQIPAGSLRAAHAPPRKCEDTEPDIVVKHLEPTAQDRNSEHPCESPIDNLGYSRREEPATTRRSQPVLPERE